MNISIIDGPKEYDIPHCIWNIDEHCYNTYGRKQFIFYYDYLNNELNNFMNAYPDLSNHDKYYIHCNENTVYKFINVKGLVNPTTFDDFIQAYKECYLYPHLIVSELKKHKDTYRTEFIFYARRVIIKQHLKNY